MNIATTYNADLNETFVFLMDGEQQLMMTAEQQEMLTALLHGMGCTITGGHDHSISVADKISFIVN